MLGLGAKKAKLDRNSAMNARPVRLAAVNTEEKGGKLHVTVEYNRPVWQRAFGAVGKYKRTYALDDYGREVYEYCDGKSSTTKLARKFSERHSISRPEAELAVTSFLKTLVGKGLVAMAVAKQGQ